MATLISQIVTPPVPRFLQWNTPPCPPPPAPCEDVANCEYRLPIIEGDEWVQVIKDIGIPAGVYNVKICDNGVTVGTMTVTAAGNGLLSIIWPAALANGYYRLCVKGFLDVTLLCSSLIEQVCDACYTTLCEFHACGDIFGIPYTDVFGGGDKLQRFRVALEFREVRQEANSKVMTTSQGVTKMIYARFTLKRDMIVDYSPCYIREMLNFALHHDAFVALQYGLATPRQFVPADNALEVEKIDRFPEPPLKRSTMQVLETPYNPFNPYCNNCI